MSKKVMDGLFTTSSDIDCETAHSFALSAMKDLQKDVADEFRNQP